MEEIFQDWKKMKWQHYDVGLHHRYADIIIHSLLVGELRLRNPGSVRMKTLTIILLKMRANLRLLPSAVLPQIGSRQPFPSG